MNDPLSVALALVAGMLLGVFFFGGLWWTVRKGVTATRPALWFLVSMFLRTSVTLVGFYFVSRGQWERLLICLAGFLISRVLIMWLTRSPQPSSNPPTQETPHAS